MRALCAHTDRRSRGAAFVSGVVSDSLFNKIVVGASGGPSVAPVAGPSVAVALSSSSLSSSTHAVLSASMGSELGAQDAESMSSTTTGVLATSAGTDSVDLATSTPDASAKRAGGSSGSSKKRVRRR